VTEEDIQAALFYASLVTHLISGYT
jgi:hypothetical protein